jgi:hypothetical protein
VSAGAFDARRGDDPFTGTIGVTLVAPLNALRTMTTHSIDAPALRDFLAGNAGRPVRLRIDLVESTDIIDVEIDDVSLLVTHH